MSTSMQVSGLAPTVYGCTVAPPLIPLASVLGSYLADEGNNTLKHRAFN